MILDMQDSFLSTATPPLETIGGYASGVSDYRDTGEASSLDGHRKLYLNIEGIANLTSDGADTVTITLTTDTATGFATAKRTLYTSGAIAKGAVAATRTKILVPEGASRYIRVEWTISAIGTSSAGGTFKAFLSVS